MSVVLIPNVEVAESVYPVPFPTSSCPKDGVLERPVPPLATVRADERFRVPVVRVPKFALVEKRLVELAVVEKRLVVVAAVVVERVMLLKMFAPVQVLLSERRVVEAVDPLEPTQVPFTAKHPEDKLIPTLDVEVAEPEMFRPASVVVPKPVAETENTVVEAELTNSAILPVASPQTESLEYGVVVPIAKPPFSETLALSVPFGLKTIESSFALVPVFKVNKYGTFNLVSKLLVLVVNCPQPPPI